MKRQKSAILQMFYGQRGNAESIKRFDDGNDIINAADSNYIELCKKLKSQPELLDLFIKYKDSMDDLLIREIDNHFAEGFKFGLLIGVEAGESKFSN